MDEWRCLRSMSLRYRYAQVCHRVLADESIKMEQFAKELLPSVITLSMDKIPNVRLSVAKLLSQRLLHLGTVIHLYSEYESGVTC